ncbi:hypothetical protein [uncultured Paraglaciecola sp.]|uniref:hypothetical protein n=1 Tax=uncultured Paraglaciecola sp. TaxID=1765024 RepID=UPI002603E77F|nr:hypothetical protein [uncultured Paraglaciecola sp.]
MKSLATILFTALLITGCATGDVFKAAQTGVHMKLLDAEFDQARTTVRELPLNEAESAEIESVIAELEVERQALRTLHKQNAGRIALSAVQAQSTLDDVESAVKRGRIAYQGYLARTKEPVNPLLKSYHESAVIARDNIQEAIDSGAGVSAGELAQYFGLALRTIAAINGVPVI